MPDPSLTCLLRRTYDPATLLREHPPVLHHAHKRLVFDLACPPGATHAGLITVTRWAAATLPVAAVLAPTEVTAVPGFYDYGAADAGVWHVNFADSRLFVAYGSRLLAQDELQAAEHPLLGAIREALLAEGQPAVTEQAGGPTPVLVTGIERRCALATAPDVEASRPYGLYGAQFARARPEVIRAAVRVLDPPTRTNLIAMAAPCGGTGPYWRRDLEHILTTAYTGFAAAAHTSRRTWPDAPVVVCTGFWGCGAFGGNRRAMTLLQLLAARLAGVDRVRFHAANDAGRAAFERATADLAGVLAAATDGAPLADVIERVDDLDYEWGAPTGD